VGQDANPVFSLVSCFGILLGAGLRKTLTATLREGLGGALHNAHLPVEKIGKCGLRALIRGGGDRRSKSVAQGIKSQKLGARSPPTSFFSKWALDFRRKCDNGHVYLHSHRISARIVRLALVGEKTLF